MNTLPSGNAKALREVSAKERCGQNTNAPREQVRRKTPAQELGRPRSIFLAREELVAERGVGVVERRRLVDAADDEQATVEDTNGSRVPPLDQKVKGVRVVEERAALAGGGLARLEDADSLVARVDGRVSGEAIRVAADADLRRSDVSIPLRGRSQ